MARKDIQNVEMWQKMAGESEYNVGAMAKRMGMSRRHLQRSSKALFARSPREWLKEERLVLAAALMKEHKSVKVVAAQLCYKKASHFSREFRLRYGLSPTEYVASSPPPAAII